MLTLETPFLLGKYSYTHLVGGVRLGIEMRGRRLEVHVGAGRRDQDDIIIGTRETDEAQVRVIPPPVVHTFTIDDPQGEPSLAVLWQRVQLVIESIEQFIDTQDLLTDKTFQAGEEEVDLACTFAPYPGVLKLAERVRLPRATRETRASAEERRGE